MREEVISLLSSTNRPGIENVLTYLDHSDFYTCPSSTIYHNSCRGGLLAHSLNVYKASLRIRDILLDVALPEKNIASISNESLILCTILHDLCKTNFYEQTTKMYKDEAGAWHRYQTYQVNNHHPLPLGHGERSVTLLLMLGLQLKPEEIVAIRFHMGMSDPGMFISPYTKTSMMTSINDYPLCEILILADHMASFTMEREIDQKTENEVALD